MCEAELEFVESSSLGRVIWTTGLLAVTMAAAASGSWIRRKDGGSAWGASKNAKDNLWCFVGVYDEAMGRRGEATTYCGAEVA